MESGEINMATYRFEDEEPSETGMTYRFEDTLEPPEEKSTLGAFARTLTRVPENLVASGITAIQGVEGPSVTNRGVGDRFVNWVDERNKALAKEYEGAGDFIPGLISKQDVAQLGQNLAFSGVSMGATVAGGVVGTLTPVPGAALAGSLAVGGLAAHRMQSYQAMNDWLNKKNEESIKQFGRSISPAEESVFKDEFSKLATESGLWEAGPEAVGNVLELALIRGKKLLPGAAKLIPDTLLGKVARGAGRVAGIGLTEEITEATTQLGQTNVETKAGQGEEAMRSFASPEDWLKSAKEVLPQVLMLTGFMGAGSVAVRKLSKKLQADPLNQSIDQQMGELAEENKAVSSFELAPAPITGRKVVTEETPLVAPVNVGQEELGLKPPVETIVKTLPEVKVEPSTPEIVQLGATSGGNRPLTLYRGGKEGRWYSPDSEYAKLYGEVKSITLRGDEKIADFTERGRVLNPEDRIARYEELGITKEDIKKYKLAKDSEEANDALLRKYGYDIESFTDYKNGDPENPIISYKILNSSALKSPDLKAPEVGAKGESARGEKWVAVNYKGNLDTIVPEAVKIGEHRYGRQTIWRVPESQVAAARSAQATVNKETTKTLKINELQETITPTKKEEAIVTTPKEQKAYVLDKLDGLITAARERWRTEYKSNYTDKEIDAGSLGKGSFRRETTPDGEEIITIEVPGDGQFKVGNDLRSLLTFKRNLSRWSTSTTPSKGMGPTKPSKPVGKSTEQITKEAQEEVDRYNRMPEDAKRGYLYFKDEALPKAEADYDKWSELKDQVDNGKRTLKSLASEFNGHVPSSKELYARRQEARDSIGEMDRRMREAEEHIRTNYPSMAKEMFGETKGEKENVQSETNRERGRISEQNAVVDVRDTGLGNGAVAETKETPGRDSGRIPGNKRAGDIRPEDTWGGYSIDDTVRQPWKTKIQEATNELERTQRENRDERTDSDTRGGRVGIDLSPNGRLQRRRLFDRFVQSFNSGSERERWSGVRYSSDFEGTVEFMVAAEHYRGLGYETVPITSVDWHGAVNYQDKVVFLGESYGDKFAYAVSHETSHILTAQNNAVAMVVKNKINIEHPLAQMLKDKLGKSDDYVRDEITASLLGGDPQYTITMRGSEISNQAILRKAQDVAANPGTMYGDVKPLSNIMKRTETAFNNIANSPKDIPEQSVKDIQDAINKVGGLRYKNIRYLFNLPYQMSQKYPDWEKQWKIQLDRIQLREVLNDTIFKVGNVFFNRNKVLRNAKYNRQQIKDADFRVGRILTIGDDKLRDIVANLKAQANQAGINQTDKMALQKRINKYETERRYSDEELKEGIEDYDGKLIKLNDTEIPLYTAARATEDSLFKEIIKHLGLMVFRTYRNQKWYHILTAATGADLTEETTRHLLGAGLNDAALTYAKKIQVNLNAVWQRIDNEIEKTSDAEKMKVGELYGKLSEKIQTDLTELKGYISKITGEKDAKKLEEITREVFSAYRMTSPQLKKIKNLRNQFNQWIGFFPRERDQGNFKMQLMEHVIDEESGDLVRNREIYSKMFNSERQGKNLYREIMDKYAKDGKLPENWEILPPVPVTKTPEGAFQGVSDVNVQKVIEDALKNREMKTNLFDAEGKPVDAYNILWDDIYEAIAGQFQSRGAGKHLMHRKQALGEGAIKGYKETNHDRILINHITSMTGLISKQRAAFDSLEAMRDLQDPSLFDELSAYAKGQFRNDTSLDRASSAVRGFIFTWTLGGLIKSAGLNSTQPIIIGIPMLARYMRKNKITGYMGSINKANKIQLKASYDVATGNLDDTEKHFINQLVVDGSMKNQYIRSIIDTANTMYGQTVMAVINFLASPFSGVEIYNRKSSGLAMFRTAYPMYVKQGLSAGIDGEAYAKAVEDAHKFIYDVHYPMGKHNLPLPAQGGDILGAGIKTTYIFRTFNHNFILNMINLARTGGKSKLEIRNDVATFVHTLAYMALFGGLMGWPLKDIFEWFEKQYGYSPTSYVRKTLRGIGGETLEKFGMNGLPAILGVNISGSLAIGIPFVGEELGSTLGGVVEGQIQKLYRAGEAALRGDLYRTASNILPEFLRAPLTAAVESSVGKELFGTPGYATTTGGRPIYAESGKPLSMGPFEAGVKSLGFVPAGFGREREMEQTIKRQEAWYSDKVATAGARFRIARINHDPNATRDLIRAVTDINEGRKSRGIEKLVPRASVSRIIQSSRQVKGAKERRERLYKAAEL